MSEALLSRRSKVLRFFPVPRYLALGAVACSIEDKTLRFIELSPQGNNMIVRRFGNRELPTPLANDADEIPADLKKAVAKFISEEKIRSIALVLPERLTYSFFVTIPIVEPAFIRDAIAFTLEEHIPIAPAEAIFEFDIIKRNEQVKTMTIAVRAVPKKQAEKYIELFSSLGALVSGCETEGNAILSSALPRLDRTCRLVIKIGDAGTIILIAEGSSVLFSSSAPFGGEKITGIDAKSLETLSLIKDEAKKVMEYWNTRPDANNTSPATSVLLFGLATTLSGVKEYFESTLLFPVAIGNVWQNAFSFDDIIPEISIGAAQDMASIIGLSLSQ